MAYTAGLGYRPTCDSIMTFTSSDKHKLDVDWKNHFRKKMDMFQTSVILL